MPHPGEFAALFTAFCWSITVLCFEKAGKRVGSLPVNIIRLFFGLFFLSIFCFFYRGYLLPSDASGFAWFWLGLSGVVGFSLGDLFLFKAFVMIGSRIAMLMMTLVPPMTALIGWVLLGEILTAANWLGMTLTIIGIALVILEKKPGNNSFTFNRPVAGLLYAFGGAMGQAVGLVLSKYGMKEYDPFASTQIRIIAGIAGFLVLFTLLGKWNRVQSALRDRTAMKYTASGSFFGPFLGVSFSLVAVQYTVTGVASTIMSITPVLLIPPAIFLFKEKISSREILGAFIAICGVGILFLV